MDIEATEQARVFIVCKDGEQYLSKLDTCTYELSEELKDALTFQDVEGAGYWAFETGGNVMPALITDDKTLKIADES